MSHRIVILGAGISGLATAWYLKQALGSDASIQVIEKSGRAGGWIQSLRTEGFLFEQGPRSCRSKGFGYETLALIENLGLHGQVILPPRDSSYRYLYQQETLKRLPKHLWEIPFNSLTSGWLRAFWNDWQMPRRNVEDESIHSFFSRRLGSIWADRLIDPFVLGIYAGDCRRLSLKSCFPVFEEWEQTQGSLLRGAWSYKTPHHYSSAFIEEVRRFPLFSFKEGMEALPRALAHELKNCLMFGSGVNRLEKSASGITVHLENGGSIFADHLISTLPSYALASILPASPEIAKELETLPYATVGIVNMGFDESVLPQKGFGYLVPTSKGDIVLGCVWDSCLFPQQNERKNQTRLTFMLGGSHHPEIEHMSDGALAEHGLRALREQMGIHKHPKAIQVNKARRAIPQFEVGHTLWKTELQKKLQQFSPRLMQSGSAWSGVSINDCISQARRLAQTFAL